MTFPAGPLPGPGQYNDLFQRIRPAKSVAFTHGTSDLDLTDPANGLTPAAIEFFATSTGNLVAQLAQDSSPQTYAVTAGVTYPGIWVLAKSTSTANGIFRQ